MSTIIRQPSIIHAAFNPIIVEMEDFINENISIGVQTDNNYSLTKSSLITERYLIYLQ